MPVVCRLISTQIIKAHSIKNLRQGRLTARVVEQSGGAITADQLEELRFSLEDWETFRLAYIAAHPKPVPAWLPLVRSFGQKMIALGFTKNELRAAFRFLNDWDE